MNEAQALRTPGLAAGERAPEVSRSKEIQWTRHEHFLISKDGQFTVARVSVMGVIQYEAWHFKKLLKGRLDSAEKAKAVCQRASE